MSKLLNIFQIAEKKGRSVREIRTLVQTGKIPYLRVGHRTIWFDEQKVDQALKRFEIKAVDAK
jgi:ABC-type cobalamin/Fe3+-siderophores transport system ATPase subunit